MNIPISVIIPTFNRADIVTGSIKSVLNQTYSNFEIIVVDDGSKDDTESVIKKLITDYGEKLRYFKLDENQGTANARNFGVSKAKYDIIAFNDRDDHWHSDKLMKQVSFLKENPDCKLVYCAYALKSSLEDIVYRKVPEVGIDSSEDSESTFLQLLYYNTIGTPTMLLDKSAFLAIGGFDTSLQALEDWDLAVRMAIVGKVGFLDEILVSAYGGTGQNRMSLSKDNYYQSRCSIINKYKQVLLELGILDVYIKGIMERASEDQYLENAQTILMEYGFEQYL